MKKLLLISLVIFIFLISNVSAESSYSQNSTVSSGGTNLSGTDFSTDIIVSQISGNTSSSNYESQFGFFYAIKNNAPECSTIPEQTWNQDTVKTINLSTYISDIDNDVLIYSNTAAVSDIAASYNQNTGVVTLTPTAGFSGTRYIIFNASDYAETVECNSVKLTVSSTAVPPATTALTQGQSRGDELPSASSSTGFNLDKDLFHVKLVQGGTKRETLKVRNVGDSKLEFIVDIGNLKKFLIADDYAFELESGMSKDLNFDFFASEAEQADVHTGQVLIKASGKTQAVNTIVEIISKKALFDIILSVSPENRNLKSGQPLKANITLINLGDLRGVDVELDYIIKDMNGKSISSQHDTRGVLEKQLSFEKEFDTHDLKKGDYVVYAKLTYLGAVASSSELFTITSGKSPILTLLPYIAGFIALIIIVGLIIIIISIKKGERIDERLLSYINSLRENFGSTEFKEAAKEKLVSAGWKKKVIKKAFEKVGIEK